MSKRGAVLLLILGLSVVFREGWLIPGPSRVPLDETVRYEPEVESSWYYRFFNRAVAPTEWEEDNFRPPEKAYRDPEEGRRSR
jgi:hypothetical protein